MISVIIVNNNNDATLRQALSAAQQADELIVVEDCSDLPPRHLHLSESVIVNAQPVGLANCWNMAVNIAKGDKIICLCGDEILDSGFLNYCRQNEIKCVLHGKVGNSTLPGWWRTTPLPVIKERKDVLDLPIHFSGCFPKWLWKKIPFRGKSEAPKNFLIDNIEKGYEVRSVDIPMFVKRDPNLPNTDLLNPQVYLL